MDEDELRQGRDESPAHRQAPAAGPAREAPRAPLQGVARAQPVPHGCLADGATPAHSAFGPLDEQEHLEERRGGLRACRLCSRHLHRELRHVRPRWHPVRGRRERLVGRPQREAQHRPEGAQGAPRGVAREQPAQEPQRADREVHEWHQRRRRQAERLVMVGSRILVVVGWRRGPSRRLERDRAKGADALPVPPRWPGELLRRPGDPGRVLGASHVDHAVRVGARWRADDVRKGGACRDLQGVPEVQQALARLGRSPGRRPESHAPEAHRARHLPGPGREVHPVLREGAPPQAALRGGASARSGATRGASEVRVFAVQLLPHRAEDGPGEPRA
mmetsp:Transcript_6925/g.20408  ORF Transcript_6925/g.20408 Transcript_6925/m.20408 type:complete len:333 (-) Transcript_6925:573-1571(-)